MGFYSNRTRLEKCLDQICFDLGFDLHADDYSKIQEKLPLSIDEFVEEVILAEGFSPGYDGGLRKSVKQIISKWFESEVKNDAEK